MTASPKVQERIDGYDLVANDIPALTDEDYSPPMDSYSYRVLFYYSPQFSGKDFWKDEGKTWSKDVDRFANPSDKIRTAVAGIVAPNDTEQQKLQKKRQPGQRKPKRRSPSHGNGSRSSRRDASRSR